MGMCFNCDRQLMFYDLKRVSIRLAQLNTERETLMADFSISATSVADFYFIFSQKAKTTTELHLLGN